MPAWLAPTNIDQRKSKCAERWVLSLLESWNQWRSRRRASAWKVSRYRFRLQADAKRGKNVFLRWNVPLELLYHNSEFDHTSGETTWSNGKQRPHMKQAHLVTSALHALQIQWRSLEGSWDSNWRTWGWHHFKKCSNKRGVSSLRGTEHQRNEVSFWRFQMY